MKPNLDKVPKTLDEALELLEAALEPADREHLRAKGSEETHFAGGLWCRNNWSLWDPETPLHKWFNQNTGLGHADDMSGVLMESLARRVRGQDLDLEGQAKYYKDFWRERGIDPLTQQPITA